MPEYIEREEVLKLMRENLELGKHEFKTEILDFKRRICLEAIVAYQTCIALVETAPEIDPIHAAGGCYCRECKYKSTGRNNFGVYFYCGNPESGLSNIQIEKDFCSYGRRREETNGH